MIWNLEQFENFIKHKRNQWRGGGATSAIGTCTVYLFASIP